MRKSPAIRQTATSRSPLMGEGRGEGVPEAGRDGRNVVSSAPHVHCLRVYIEDTDAGGMVYYANYLKFAERARTEMLRAAGISHAEMIGADGLMLVVRRCAVDFLKSARLDDDLTIETRVLAIGGASVELEQRVSRPSGGGAAELLATLKVLIACITGAGRATRLPESLRRVMQRGHRSTTDK